MNNAILKAVRNALPDGGGKTAQEIFENINWWVLESVQEALAELVKSGECIKGKRVTETIYRRR